MGPRIVLMAKQPLPLGSNPYMHMFASALVPPHLRTPGGVIKPPDQYDEQGIDNQVSARVDTEQSDYVRGAAPGKVARIRQTASLKRFTTLLKLTTTNGTNFDCSSCWQEVIINFAADTFIFNASPRANVMMLYSINSPIMQIQTEGGIFVPNCDVKLSSLSSPTTVKVMRGHHKVYVGMYILTASIAAPFYDCADFTAINSTT